MITKITGQLSALREESAILSAPPFEYEVLIPEYTRRHLQSELGKTVSLHTICSLDGNPQGKMIPRLIGFLTEAERQFFELFCSVDGVGTKKALQAMVRPVNEVAEAIEVKDDKFLSSLPGIGPAMAERIVAKLRRKVAKFVPITRSLPEEGNAIVSETFEILLKLGHSNADARKLIDAVLQTGTKFKDSTEMSQAIFQQRR